MALNLTSKVVHSIRQECFFLAHQHNFQEELHGWGGGEWSPLQVLLCPCSPHGVSENFGGEGDKMVVETTGGHPEKGK